MRALVLSSPRGRVASICEEADGLQIASPLRMTQRTITPSSDTVKGCGCCEVTRSSVVVDSLRPWLKGLCGRARASLLIPTSAAS